MSLINESTFQKIWKRKEAPGFREPKIQLKTYSGEQLQIIGEVEGRVCCVSQMARVPLVVVQGQRPNLFGRNWMNEFQLDWRKIFYVSYVQREITAGARESPTIDSILKRFPDVFDEGRGQLKETVASFCVDPDTKPRFNKPRPVQFTHRENVEQALRKLEREGP